VTQVKAIEMAGDRLTRAKDLEPVIAAAWEAFEIILAVSYQYGGRKSDWFATWMWAMSPACEGRDALGPAPSRESRRIRIGPGDLSAVSEDDAADASALLAAQLDEKLRAVTGHAAPADARACLRAAQSARELREIFAAGA
jgi:hypothetical protein